MYLVRSKSSKGFIYFLVVIDNVTNQRCKRYVNEDLALSLLKNCHIKLFENVSQEVKEV